MQVHVQMQLYELWGPPNPWLTVQPLYDTDTHFLLGVAFLLVTIRAATNP
jgi:hypothetical protein